SFDTESLFRKSRADMIAMLDDADKEDIDESVDEQAIFSKILLNKLDQLDERSLAQLVQIHWADFDLLAEERRIPEGLRLSYRTWATEVIDGGSSAVEMAPFRGHVIQVFISNAITFERRAKLFREIHP